MTRLEEIPRSETAEAGVVVELRNDRLAFRFPGVHEGAEFGLDFQRTLRIPDDGREHFLPPGLGRFPLERVDDFPDRIPEVWDEHGGIFLPMHQAEAMWINFSGHYPMAVKVSAGKINALTGEEWTEGLCEDPQDYLVVPDQPWLDGFSVARGLTRQFVALPLGKGTQLRSNSPARANTAGCRSPSTR